MTLQDQVSNQILKKMFLDHRIGAKRISLQSLKTGFPSHLKGDVGKQLKKLVKQNLVLTHPTSYGPQYALNQKKVARDTRNFKGLKYGY